MRDTRGFTLIELMIVVAVVAMLAAVAYPSYTAHVAKAQRAAGQQFLADIAQRQEQFLLDRRQYATTLGTGATGLGITALPNGIKYSAPVSPFTLVDNTATPPIFTICIEPVAGSNLAQRGDGRLCVDSAGRQWREAITGADSAFTAGTDCPWTDSTCKIAGEY